MLRRFTLLMIVLSFSSGVLAGTPLYAPKDGMMECCKRAKSNEHSPKAEAARLCCAINCTTTSPTSSGASFNSAPAGLTVTRSIADQIAELFASEKTVFVSPSNYFRKVFTRTSQPSYIRHHAFLI